MTAPNEPKICVIDVLSSGLKFRWKTPEPFEIGLLCLIIGIFRQHLLDAMAHKPCGPRFLLKSQPNTMPLDSETSILDEALACIGQRITSILIEPAEIDSNYVESLHNEVVRRF